MLQPWREVFVLSLATIMLGYLMAFICGILWTADMIIIYWYPFLQSPTNQIKTIFWICVIATVISLLGALAIEEINLNISWSDWLLVFGHAAGFGLVLIFYMYACSILPGILNALIACTSNVYLVIAQYTFLSSIHPGNRNVIEILGVVLVIISSTVPSVIKAKEKSNNEPKAETPQE